MKELEGEAKEVAGEITALQASNADLSEQKKSLQTQVVELNSLMEQKNAELAENIKNMDQLWVSVDRNCLISSLAPPRAGVLNLWGTPLEGGAGGSKWGIGNEKLSMIYYILKRNCCGDTNVYRYRQGGVQKRLSTTDLGKVDFWCLNGVYTALKFLSDC